ncbi:X-box-binding protein 1-like [Lingula anatina]|uniref:X-box-binding protein 1 n=1 Tax=Lingula anatina TaxID=7574 RepID=A0A1S3HS18_LINAN|nr:X-box-binding protein 1-like [Lingula anatina]|eukprot:XP_013387849.1 X-box-binding protein 1-like [Lingula anatina]
MTSLGRRTILITTVPQKPTSPVVMEVPAHVVEDEPLEPGRKRRRLTHLTQEEKMLRRKLKNRVAAQTARDRKKARMSDLEAELNTMERENKRLQAENISLRQKSNALFQENQQLKERLGQNPEGVVILKKEHSSPESAALNLPQQQEKMIALSLLMTHLVACLMTWNMIFLDCSNNYRRKRVMSQQKSLLQTAHSNTFPCKQPLLTWWGPQQKSWNPSMNS